VLFSALRLCLGTAIAAAWCVAATNQVRISHKGQPIKGRPFTISRVFAKGEMKEFALATRDGNPVFSQCDVKTRWDDGSLQHAMISFLADVSSNEKLEIAFVNSPVRCSLESNEACDAAALNADGMAEFNGGEWGAAIDSTLNGQVHRTDVRAMIGSGAWRYWLRGPVVTQVIVEDKSPSLAFDWGYKDKSTAVLAGPITASGTTIPLSDGSDVQPGSVVRIDSEEVLICRNSENSAVIGTADACPSAQGRAQNGTTAAVHQRGAILRTTAEEDRAGWEQRVVGYTAYNFQRGVAVNATTMPVYGNDLLPSIPVPFIIQVGTEQMSVCKVVGGQPGTLSFGKSTDRCPNIDGRGVNETKAQAHPDNIPIFSPNWPGKWVDAPSERYKSLHPVFICSFYKDWAGVRIDYVVENVWLGKMQDQFYSVSLLSGTSLGNSRLSQSVHHRANTRWRRTFWDGAEPPAADLDLNFEYMIHSRVLPNYDRSRNVPQNSIVADYNRAKAGGMGNLNAAGIVYPAMPAAGGRSDLGLFTAWDVRYLYTFDPRRENDPGRKLDAAGSAEAFGLPVSADARPRFVTHWLDVADAVDPVGIVSNYPGRNLTRRMDNWNVDIAHQPGLAFVPYLVTGDWFYLEELQFWASRNLLEATDGTCAWCRHDDWAFISESNAETRGLAWGLRSVGHAAFFTPDGTPEKTYFQEKFENNVAIREGVMNITNGTYHDPDPASMWSWGRNVVAAGVANPLRFPHRTLGTTATPAPAAGGKACIAESAWMYNLNHITWGHLEELGFSSIRPLRLEAAKNLLQQILDPEYPKSLLGAAYLPTRGLSDRCVDPPPFASWKDVADSVPDSERTAAEGRWKAGAGDAEFGYPSIALAAASFLSGIADPLGSGDDAWNWIKSNVVNQGTFNANPKWAILPRRDAGLDAVTPQSVAPRRRPIALKKQQQKKKPFTAFREGK
jgi:hypothetical protein